MLTRGNVLVRERRRHKAPSQSFPQGGLADEGGPDPLDLDGARRARAVSRMVPTGQHPPNWGVLRPWGRETRLRSAARIERPGSARGAQSGAAAALCSAVPCFAAMLGLGARTTPLRFASSFDSMATCESIVDANATGTRIGMTRAREPHCRVPSATVSPCPDAYVRRRRVAKPAAWGPWERQSLENSSTFHSSGSGKRTPRNLGAVDSERVGFLPYGPLVSDWLAFLAERLTAEFLRDVAGGPRP